MLGGRKFHGGRADWRPSDVGTTKISEQVQSPTETRTVSHRRQRLSGCFQHLDVASCIQAKAGLKEMGVT